MKKIATTQKSIMARPISFLWLLNSRMTQIEMEKKNQPGESCPLLCGFPDLHIDEDVEDGQEGEGEDVHEDKVQPSHVYLMEERNMKSSLVFH